jgi:hypothetical protein
MTIRLYYSHIIVAFFLFIATSYSQYSQQWVYRYNGTNNNDASTSIKASTAGNVYITGYSFSGGSDYDYLTIKLSSNGEQLWGEKYNGPGNGPDQAGQLLIDAQENVYVTGSSFGNGTASDIATIKYNSSGELQWVARYNGSGSGNDGPTGITLDESGNIYICGYITSKDNGLDMILLKYGPGGELLWASTYNSPNNSTDFAAGLAIDNSGNIIIAGHSDGYKSGKDFMTVKFNSDGKQVWVQKYNGPFNGNDQINAIGTDREGNIFVTGFTSTFGSAMDLTTIKYSSTGNQMWVDNYNGPGNAIDQGLSLVVDKDGFVYVTGVSMGSGTDFDFVTIKYNGLGIELWASRYNGSGNSVDHAFAVTTDNLGSIYVTGHSWNGTDDDYTTIKYNELGTELWVAKYNGPGNSVDEATANYVDPSGNVYITGSSIGSATLLDYAAIKYSQSAPQASPNLTSPAYGSSGLTQTPTLEWTVVPGCDIYKIQISADEKFTNIIYENEVSSVFNQFTIPENTLSNNTRYYWRVSCKNIIGQSPWSSILNFAVLNAPDTPELINPANASTGHSPLVDFKWKDVSTASSYRLQIARDNKFNEIVKDVSDIKQSEYTVQDGLDNNQMYFWRVNATNVGGTVPWSYSWNFATGNVAPPPQPVLLSLPDGSLGQSTTPLLDWKDIPSVIKYRLQIASDLNFTKIVYDYDTLTQSQFSVPPGLLSIKTTYYWKVSASNLGGTGNWSLIWTFTSMLSGLHKIGNDLPVELKLYDNNPEPFSSSTEIRFDIPMIYDNTNVSIIIYDLNGREITRLLNEKVKAGKYSVSWDGSNYTRGYYLYQLHAIGLVQTKKMLFIK